MINLATAMALAVLSSLATALSVYALAGCRRESRLADGLGEDDVAFLFRSGRLVDATAAARLQMPAEPEQADDLARFVLAFGQRFEGLARQLTLMAPGERVEIPEVPDDPDSLRLTAERHDGTLRIALTDPLRGTRSEGFQHYSLAAMRAELVTLRSIAERSPIPTWKRRHDGSVIWANSAYMTLARQVAGAEALIGWPPPDLFEAATAPPAGDGEPSETVEPARRVSLTPPETDQPLWFDLIALPGEIETLFFALPIDKLVRAENALTEFVQTLTKTFADLRVGLAIFDRKRRLVLFNPALVDLTGLPAEQLGSRPTLHAFLDALRDHQRIPEPKDYKTWRMQIAQLEAGAADGTFEETWHLPNGQTFRVSGRPHPDGAVAYLFEDISSEVSMTRSFRSEIEIGQAVIDGLDTAVAAFSRGGVMSMANRAYRELWGDPGTGQTGITDTLRHWQTRCRPGPDLERLRSTLADGRARVAWSGRVERTDGTLLACSVRPVSGGATLVSFAPLPAEAGAGAPSRASA